AEDLLARHPHGVVAGDERGRYIEAGWQIGRPLAAEDDLAAVLDRRLDMRLDPPTLRRRDDRPDDGRGVGGIAHLEVARHLDEPVAHLVEDAPVHDRPRRRGADLPGVEGQGGADAADGPLDVCVLEDEAGALATELEQRALHGARRLLTDL